jgi:hypothetical protein
VSDSFTVDGNYIVGCNQAGAATAYGVMSTGDENGGDIALRSSISFNIIADIPSWDGIMSHDCSGLRVIGNDIRNVRAGIDLGPVVNTNLLRDLEVIGNYIESTSTNTWGATPASHAGIIIEGYDNTHLINRVVIALNIIRNFFTTAGIVISGDASNIVLAYCARAVISDNIVDGAGTINTNAGVYVIGQNDGVVVVGNSLQGSMSAGGVRFASVLSAAAAINANTIKQVTASDPAINITGSTIGAFSLGDNATNSTTPFTQSTSTLGYSGACLQGSATYDPPNLADGAGASTDVTVTGANMGDFAIASFSLDTQGITVTAWVRIANTVTVRFQNESGGALDLASGTLRVRVIRMLS